MITVALLLAWHHISRERWQLSVSVLYTMFAECAVLALGLLFLARAEGRLAQLVADVANDPAGALSSITWLLSPRAAIMGRLLGFLGAGIYEEMLFRLMLVPPIAFCVERLGADRRMRIATAVICTSLVFAAAHYVGPQGEAFRALSFSFRFTAGMVFALLFVFRGFGIAAGTHALYDIFVSFG